MGQSEHHRVIWLQRILLPPLLAAPLFVVLQAGTTAVIQSRDLGLLAMALLSVCAAVVALALVGTRLESRILGNLLQLAAAAAYGALFAFHLRETTAFPPKTWAMAAIALFVTALTVLFLRLACGRPGAEPTVTRADRYLPRERRKGWGWLLVTAILALAMPTALFLVGGLPRWHLLHHLRALGNPTQVALGKSPQAREQEQVELIALDGDEAARRIADRFAPPATPFDVGPDSPSIVFVMLDTLRADAFTAWGGEQELMPRLAQTIERCQRFGDVLANSSWTRPSIASMHTGLLPEHHGARGMRDPLESGHLTFIEVLQSAGYRTLGLVTNPTAALASGLDQGFDEFRLLEREPYARAEVLNRAALELLDSRDDEDGADSDSTARTRPPIFLYLHYLDPHEPYLAGVEPDGWSQSSYREAYAAELEELDRRLDEVLPQIRDRLGEDTLFFLISDHGEEFFEHDLFGHGHTLYREVVDIPAALCGGPFEGGVIEERLEGRDVFSLMVGLANGTVSSNIDLVRWARAHQRRERNLYLSFRGFGRLQLRPYLQSVYQRAVETPDGVWIWNAYGDTWEHYDSEDRRQVENLAGSLEPPEERLQRSAPAPWYLAEPLLLDQEGKDRLNALGYVQ